MFMVLVSINDNNLVAIFEKVLFDLFLFLYVRF